MCVHHSEQVQQSGKVVVVVVERFLQRLANRLKSCKVDYGIKGGSVRAARWRVSKDCADGSSITQVSLRRAERPRRQVAKRLLRRPGVSAI